jgi:hypothetical protein
MLLALDWKTVIYMAICLHELQERRPCLVCITTLEEGLRIANHDESIAGSRKQDIKTLRRKHEPNVASFVAARERHNDNVTLFTLVVVCGQEG